MRRSNLNRGAELAKNGFLAKDSLRSARQRASGQAEAVAGDGPGRRSARPSSISPTPKSARRSPGGSAAIRRRSARWSARGRLSLNTLVQLDPIYVTFNPSEARSRRASSKAKATGAVDGRGPVCPATGTTAAGRTDLHRQYRRPRDRNHRRRARRSPTPNFTLLPGQYVRVRICMSARARCADGAADGDRIEPARQIRLRRRSREQGASNAWFRWGRRTAISSPS